LGSGKSEIPCERMHRANFKFAVRSAGLPAVGGGSSDLHASLAALNCGERGLMPVPCPAFSASPPWGLGSGKPVIPCERRHREYASPLSLADPPARPAPVPVPGELEQAAASRARQASTAATRPGCRSRARCLLPCPPPPASLSYMSCSISGAADRA